MSMTTDDLADLARLRHLLADGLARHLREGAGLSLNATAHAVGISRQTLTAWERGTFRPVREREAALRYLALLDRLMVGGRDAS